MNPTPLPEGSFAPTIVDLLRQRAAYRPHDRAFTFLVDGENEELNNTYAELDQKARTIGAWLMDRGMYGKRVLLLYPSGLDFIAAFMGCLYGGAIAVPAYPPRKNRSVERIEAIAADANASVALTTRDVLDRFDTIKASAPSLEHLVWQVNQHQTTAPSLKIGRYMDTTIPPINVPRNTMMMGSIKLDRPATISSTSAS